MENYMGMKMKRKELEDVNDDFAEFSFLSPAFKIRRLDAELPPIIEEAQIPTGYEQLMPKGATSEGVGDDLKSFVNEELPFDPVNDEKAIVLYKPMNNPLFYSPSNLSIDPDLISGFKNHALWGSHLSASRPNEEDEAMRDEDTRESEPCKAVIPWVPSDQSRPPFISSQSEFESMDADQMEVEGSGASNVGQLASDYSNQSRIDEGLQHQWQQPHCMIPQPPPQYTTTPVVWYR